MRAQEQVGPATIRFPCTITMDHDAIIYSMNEPLLREVQIKMFTSRAWEAKSTLLIM